MADDSAADGIRAHSVFEEPCGAGDATKLGDKGDNVFRFHAQRLAACTVRVTLADGGKGDSTRSRSGGGATLSQDSVTVRGVSAPNHGVSSRNTG